jgi:hypothetical protein
MTKPKLLPPAQSSWSNQGALSPTKPSKVAAKPHSMAPVVLDVPDRVVNSSSRETYTGSELKPYAGRPGAMDAFKLPSRSFEGLTYRKEGV